MSEEASSISLGGKTWSVPHLPFRAIKAIQPALFEIYLAAGGASMSGESVARLSEAQLDRLAEATWRAISFVEPELSLPKFLDLPFSVGELIQAFPSVAKAAGLRPGKVEDRLPCASDAGGVAKRGKVDFDALIAQVVSNTGWSWDEALDQLTMPRLLALRAEWRRNPPVHWLVAAALKYREPDEAAIASPANDCRTEGGLSKRRPLMNHTKLKDQRWPTQTFPSASALQPAILFPRSARQRMRCRAFAAPFGEINRQLVSSGLRASQAFSADHLSPIETLSPLPNRFSNRSRPTAHAPRRRCAKATMRLTPTRQGPPNSRHRKN